MYYVQCLHFSERLRVIFYLPRAYKYDDLLFFSVIEKMIVQLALALCVGFSLAQEVSENKDAIGLDGKDGAGLSNSE